MATMEDVLKKGSGALLYKLGSSVKGSIIDANASRVLVDLEGGLTGLITKKEATGFGIEGTDMEVGSQIEATVIDPESETGLVVLSLRRASQDMVWADLNQMAEEQRNFKVKIYEANKGGLMAKYKGVRTFLPVSQLMPVNYPRVDDADAGQILSHLQSHIGKEFAVRVLSVNREDGKVIISEKAAYADQIQETLKNLKVGDTAQGEVSGLVRYGIFVAFGGVEGLVHLSEIDWGHVADPSRMFNIGDKVDVMVIGVDRNKLSLSIKQLTDDPWKKKVEGYTVGQKVEGRAVRWNANGVFIEIEPEVQGVFPLEHFGVEDHSKLKISEGEMIEGFIDDIHYESRRFKLARPDFYVEKKEEKAEEVKEEVVVEEKAEAEESAETEA